MPLRSGVVPMFATIHGVDFSGARRAGRNIWIATLTPILGDGEGLRVRLEALCSLERLCGTSERAPALTHLVGLIKGSGNALWALDFPFGLPVELFAPGSEWEDQHALARDWRSDAHAFGLHCLERARALGEPGHIRRITDSEVKTPFDCYHYRIIYQTFFGMRDVLGPLRDDARTAILPFQYGKKAAAARVVLEACPSSTLKRLGLPHQNYKQPAGGPLTRVRRLTRGIILDQLSSLVEIGEAHRRVIMRNPGGDALDAVIAAAGAAWSWREQDHRRIARHARYPREGFIYG